MNDDQCEVLVKAIDSLNTAIYHLAGVVVTAIENIPVASTGGLEKRLEKLIDAVDDLADRL